jgi:hypothetical protein
MEEVVHDLESGDHEGGPVIEVVIEEAFCLGVVGRIGVDDLEFLGEGLHDGEVVAMIEEVHELDDTSEDKMAF